MAANGQRRLNIVAHRMEVNFGTERGRLQIGEGQYRAQDIVLLLSNLNVDLNNYEVVRFISCDSAKDIAGNFARLTGKNTIGYRGPATIQGRASEFAHAAIMDMTTNQGPLSIANMNIAFRQRYDHYARALPVAERMNNNIAYYRVTGEEELFYGV